MEPLTFPLTQRLVTWKTCSVFRMSWNAPSSQTLHLFAEPQSPCAVSRDLIRAAMKAEASLGWQVTEGSSLFPEHSCLLLFGVCGYQRSGTVCPCWQACLSRCPREAFGIPHAHTWHTEVTVPFQIVPMYRKAPPGAMSVLPLSLRTETKCITDPCF